MAGRLLAAGSNNPSYPPFLLTPLVSVSPFYPCLTYQPQRWNPVRGSQTVESLTF